MAIVPNVNRVPFKFKINACWAENLSSSFLFQYLFADALRFSQTRFDCSLATVVAVDTFVRLSGSEYQLCTPRLVHIRIASCQGSIFTTFIYVATSLHICTPEPRGWRVTRESLGAASCSLLSCTTWIRSLALRICMWMPPPCFKSCCCMFVLSCVVLCCRVLKHSLNADIVVVCVFHLCDNAEEQQNQAHHILTN